MFSLVLKISFLFFKNMVGFLFFNLAHLNEIIACAMNNKGKSTQPRLALSDESVSESEVFDLSI